MNQADERGERGETELFHGPTGADRVLDRAHLARQTGGDKALERELLALFAAQARDVVGRIAAGQEAPPLAHRLKGAAQAVGAWGVAEAAERVEAGGSGAQGGLDVAVRQVLSALAGHSAAGEPSSAGLWNPGQGADIEA